MKDIRNRFKLYASAEHDRTERIAKKYGASYEYYEMMRVLDHCDGHTMEEIKEFVNVDIPMEQLMEKLNDPEYVTIEDGIIHINEDKKHTYKKIRKELKKLGKDSIEAYGHERYMHLLAELDAFIFEITD